MGSQFRITIEYSSLKLPKFLSPRREQETQIVRFPLIHSPNVFQFFGESVFLRLVPDLSHTEANEEGEAEHQRE
jgi:hypothetical protein